MLGGPGPRLIARPSCAASAIQIALGWTGVHRSRERTSPSAGPQDQDYWAPGRSPAIAATHRSRSSPARCRRQTRSSARSAATTRPRATSSRWRPRRDQLESRCVSTSPGCHPRCSMVCRGVPPRRSVKQQRHGSVSDRRIELQLKNRRLERLAGRERVVRPAYCWSIQGEREGTVSSVA